MLKFVSIKDEPLTEIKSEKISDGTLVNTDPDQEALLRQFLKLWKPSENHHNIPEDIPSEINDFQFGIDTIEYSNRSGSLRRKPNQCLQRSTTILGKENENDNSQQDELK